MMVIAILLAASAEIHGLDIPPHFRNADWVAYQGCLRSELNSAGEAWQEAERETPTVVRFGTLITHCRAERSRARSVLMGFIQARHPGWSPEQVAAGAEYVLTGLDLRIMNDDRRPISDGTHAPLRERF